MQLVAAMLGDVEAPGCVEVEALAVAVAGGIAFLRREYLTDLVGVVAPDAAARFELGARIDAGGVRHAVLLLAGVRRRSHGHEQIALRVDGEGMHRVVAGDRHAAQNGLGLASRCGLTVLQIR